MIEDAENRGSAFAEASAEAKAAPDRRAPENGRDVVEDSELLRHYADTGAEDAFAEIVRRRIGLVYSVALRHTHDVQRAEDVAQRVFTDLARKAKALAGRTVIVGWLYRSAQFAASNAVRTERRRQVREQEAYTMQQIEHERPDPSWEKFRPVLDEVLNDMDDRDRDAVLLRFFDGRGFAEIGRELRLTESAARMRVERALDKMHRALGRRGVTSTTAALGIALANQAGAAPAGLAASVTGAALAGAAAVGGGAASTVGWWALFGSKAALGGVSVIAALAVGAAAYQTTEVRQRDATLASAQQERAVLQARVTAAEEQAGRATRRAQEAEKDNAELLKAAEKLRATLARGAAPDAAAAAEEFATEEQQRAAYDRAFQADMTKRRATELKRRADLEDEVAKLTPEQKLNRLIDVAESQVAHAEFQQAIRTLVVAQNEKPANVPLPEKFTQLQAALQTQSAPMEVTIASDDVTFVGVGGIRAMGKFSLNTVRLPPGDYEIIGWRMGYQSVVVPLKLRAGAPVPPLSVSCTQPDQD